MCYLLDFEDDMSFFNFISSFYNPVCLNLSHLSYTLQQDIFSRQVDKLVVDIPIM